MIIRSGSNKFGRLLAVLLLTHIPLTIADSGSDSAAGIPWQELIFESSRFWTTASSALNLERGPTRESGPSWQLTVVSSVASNQELVSLEMAADTLQITQRSRFSSGKNRRFKEYLYQPGSVQRIRREPRPGEQDLPPSDWRISGRQQLTLPPLDKGESLTSPYGLMIMASDSRLQQPGDLLRVYVHTDLNLYQAELKVVSLGKLGVNYSLHEDNRVSTVTGDRSILKVAVSVKPVGKQTDKADFELLGLTGKIKIYVDAESHIPLLVKGKAPRLGKTSIALQSAKLPHKPGE